MIRNIIFDFGDVFLNLNKTVVHDLAPAGKPDFEAMFRTINEAFETGILSSEEFLDALASSFPEMTRVRMGDVWNSMLLDLPEYRLLFLERLAGQAKYRLFLLSNTNALHIPYLSEKIGKARFERFLNCFEKVYLSHEIRLRKPDPEIFLHVLKDNSLVAEETLFIDDTEENTNAAKSLGLKTWHLEVGKEDVIQLGKRL